MRKNLKYDAVAAERNDAICFVYVEKREAARLIFEKLIPHLVNRIEQTADNSEVAELSKAVAILMDDSIVKYL